MRKNIIILIMLFGIISSIGCITDTSCETNIIQEVDILQEVDKISIPEVVTEPTELDKLLQFLEEDKTDEVIYNKDSRGSIDYYACPGFTRSLAKNASEYNITMGGISLRNTPTVGVITKYYHAMNYVIMDDSFIIIEPQSDNIFYLDTIQYHHGGVYRYVTIFPDAQMITNYGKYKETIDIDLRCYNETELVEKWK